MELKLMNPFLPLPEEFYRVKNPPFFSPVFVFNKNFYFDFPIVEILKGTYNGQKPIKPVNKNITARTLVIAPVI
jgi:hypothetical protein